MSVVVTEPVVNGLVLLHTTLGDISVELWPRECPKAVRNFIQLVLEGYYDGCLFHRVVPGFIAQTGDASGTGTGGECIYDEGTFEDEFNARLKFSRRGLVACANTGRNSNQSQFFFTLDSTPELQNKNTIFGRVGGDTLFNVLKFNDAELQPGTDKPVYPAVIKSAEVIDNPFDDIEPRITAKERKQQERAKKEMKIERAKQREQGKRKGTKNVALLSFGADPEEPVDPAYVNTKFKSSHDLLEDSRLRKEVIDDRGTSATLPVGMEGPQKRKGDESLQASEKRGRMDPPTASTSQPSSSKLEVARDAKAKANINPNDKIRAEIAKVQADLKKMSKSGDQSDEEDGKKSKKAKRTGPSLLQLEREKYSRGTAAAMKGTDAKGKKVRREDEGIMDALESFKSKLLDAKSTVVEGDETESKPEGIWGDNKDDLDEEDNDEGWLSHSLVFRKDATLDRHTIDEYSTFDPLSKNTLSLDELKYKADAAGRSKYPNAGPSGERRDGDRSRGDDRNRDGDRNRNSRGGGSGGSRNDRDNGRGNDRNQGGGNDRRGGGRSSEQYGSRGNRPEVKGSSWKTNRVEDLA